MGKKLKCHICETWVYLLRLMQKYNFQSSVIPRLISNWISYNWDCWKESNAIVAIEEPSINEHTYTWQSSSCVIRHLLFMFSLHLCVLDTFNESIRLMIKLMKLRQILTIFLKSLKLGTLAIFWHYSSNCS